MRSSITNNLVTFVSGVWSPRLRGRVDLNGASAAMRTCENFIVRRSGALRRRAGLRFVADVRVEDAPAVETSMLQYQSQVILEPVVPLDEQPFL